MVHPSPRDRVKYGILGGEGVGVGVGGQFLILIKYEPPNIPRIISKVRSGGGWVVKGHFRVPLWSKPWA